MSDRHITILHAVARELRARLRAERARERVHGRPDETRTNALERSSALADARLAAAQARRVFRSTPIARPARRRPGSAPP
jgi:hypothetical protein